MRSSGARTRISHDQEEEWMVDRILEQKHADDRERCQRRIGIDSARVSLLVQDFMASHSVTACPPGYAARSQQYNLD
jgi:hypothetical protein